VGEDVGSTLHNATLPEANPISRMVDYSFWMGTKAAYTNSDSKIDRGGKEEATQAYYRYVEETDDAANKGI
jgi:hypothetical protein